MNIYELICKFLYDYISRSAFYLKVNRKFNSIWFLILLPITFILVFISKRNTEIVEEIYSTGIYTYLGTVFSMITGVFPFSLGEIIVLLGLLTIISSIFWIIYKIISRKISLKILLRYAKNLLIAFTIIYFLFNILWGVNYYRLPFSKIANIDVKPATTQELSALCEDLIIKANGLRREISESRDEVFYKRDYNYILKNAYKGYKAVANIYPELGGNYGKPKGVIFSKAMSYMGITGIYFPFTAEANVNIDTPFISLPSTVTHEMAHQRGFAREDEANYIAYLTCKSHPELSFQYSGYILALIHSMNALYEHNKEEYLELSQKYSEELKNDLREISEYWAKYEGPVEEISDKMNNAYLKSNNQKDGVKSYGRMVDLLIAEYRLRNK